MKILHIIPSYLPATRYGGPVQSVHNMNKALVALGAEVTVYTTNADGKSRLNVPVGEAVSMDGVKIYYFPLNFPVDWYNSSSMRRAIKKTIKNFDIVHITSTFLSASTFGAYYAKKNRVPYIISPRGNLMKTPLSISRLKKKIYISIVEKRNLAGAAGIDFTSKEEERDYVDLGFPLKRSMVLPNGIRLPESDSVSAEEVYEFRKRLGVRAEEKIVSCLGRISRIKGFDTLIPALADLIHQKVPARLLIIGGDDERGYKKEVEGLISDYRLGDWVIFVGMLSGHQKEIALKATDLLIQPSESESFGMASAEAMAMGIPVVVTKGVGISSIIDEGRAGFVINKDKGELVEAIKQIIGDDQLRKELGANGRRAAEKYLSEESMAREFITEYNSIIKEYAENK